MAVCLWSFETNGYEKYLFLSIFIASCAAIYALITLHHTRKDGISMAFSKTPNLALLFVDKNGTIKFINERFEQIFELESKKFYRSKFSELALEIDEFGQIQDIQNLPNFTQNFIIKRDKIYFRVVVCTVLESGKNFDGFIMTLNDITHEKELENAVVEHERMLISNTKMVVVGEMINSISHQQRQPLSTIMLCIIT